MLRFVVLVAAVQAVLGGVAHPYFAQLNPAAVTYLSGPAPPGLAAGPAGYVPQAYAAAPAAYATQAYPAATYAAQAYAPAVDPHFTSGAIFDSSAYAAPSHYNSIAAPSAFGSQFYGRVAAFAAPSLSQGYAAPAAYATQYVSKPAFAARAYTPAVGYSAVPTVHHVPGVAEVPVTQIQHQHALIQKTVDVAKPAVQTRKFQVRRPAIQKQFYDIEERVVVRPAGSALVELDEPLSKSQKGPTVISALAHPVHAVPAFAPVGAYPSYPAYPAGYPVATPVAPAYPGAFPVGTPAAPAAPEQQQQDNFAPQQPSNFAPQQPGSFAPQQDSRPSAPQQDLESVSVDNPDFARSAPTSQPQESTPQESQQPQEPTPEAREADQRAQFENERAAAEQRAALLEQQNTLQRTQYEQQQYEQQQREASQQREAVQQRSSVPEPQPEQRAQEPTPQAAPRQSAEAPRQLELQARAFLGRQEQQLQTEARFQQQTETRDVVPSLRSLNPEVNQANQQRLIQLLTARGGVAEVQGYPAGSSRTNGPVGDAGNVRARVLSATPAPDDAEPAGERVSTRRIVVSRPIETLQEYDVVEPATKIHRVTYQQPTVFKTAHVGVARVPTSVPVYGKTLQAHPIAYY